MTALVPVALAGFKAVGLAALGGAAGTAAASALKSKPKPIMAPRPATRDDAAADVARADEIRRRRGSAADILLGPAAGEATGMTAKTLTGE
jgi:hypothetical protein